MIVTAGSTDVSIYFRVVNDVGGTNPGEPSTGLTAAGGGLASAYYIRDRGAATTCGTLVDHATPTDAHVDARVDEVDATNAPGVYRLDVPDLAFAAGTKQVTIVVKTADDHVAEPIQVDVLELDLHGEGAQASTRAAKGAILVSVNDGTPSATSFIGQDDGAGTLNSSDDAYNGQTWLFTSGALKGQSGVVSDYTGSTKTFTFASGSFTAAPSNNDEGVLLP